MTPFYRHLQGIPGFGIASDVDTIGALATVGVGAAFAGHGLISIIRNRKEFEHLHAGEGPVAPKPKDTDSVGQ